MTVKQCPSTSTKVADFPSTLISGVRTNAGAMRASRTSTGFGWIMCADIGAQTSMRKRSCAAGSTAPAPCAGEQSQCAGQHDTTVRLRNSHEHDVVGYAIGTGSVEVPVVRELKLISPEQDIRWIERRTIQGGENAGNARTAVVDDEEELIADRKSV